MSSIFITVEISDAVRSDAEIARALEEACPVDIFRATAHGTEVAEDNLDECILCGLCVDAAPPGGVRVLKRYDAATPLQR